MEKFSFDSFKESVKTNSILKDIGDNMDSNANKDMFYPDSGIAIIHERNLMKYLEKFMCKNQEELSDFLYYKKGIFLKVI